MSRASQMMCFHRDDSQSGQHFFIHWPMRLKIRTATEPNRVSGMRENRTGTVDDQTLCNRLKLNTKRCGLTMNYDHKNHNNYYTRNV